MSASTTHTLISLALMLPINLPWSFTTANPLTFCNFKGVKQRATKQLAACTYLVTYFPKSTDDSVSDIHRFHFTVRLLASLLPFTDCP